MSAIFYLPFRKVKHWSWESYWIVGGVFSWIIVPWIIAWLAVPNLLTTLWPKLPQKAFSGVSSSACCGELVARLLASPFVISVSHLARRWHSAIAPHLGRCCRQLFDGEFAGVIRTTSGLVVMGGVAVCLLGIVISGLAGIAKERELPEQAKQASHQGVQVQKRRLGGDVLRHHERLHVLWLRGG